MNAVIYARYSSDNQREESIEGQLRECKEYADQNGITVVRTYIDRALSAKTDSRPQFQQMVHDSATHTFEAVLVWKLDRFSRNRYDSAHYKRILKNNRVHVVSVTEPISNTPEGIMLESLLEGMAEYYSAELAEKVSRGHKENALKAKFNGGPVPLGYRIDSEQHYQIDPVTAPVVQEAFQRYAAGESIRSIIESLNARGIRNSRGNPFTKNSFQTLLKNRRYLGEYRYKDTVIPDAIPAIIDPDCFDAVQRRCEIHRQAPAHNKADVHYLLTTKLFCGKCGTMMAGESGRSHTGTVHCYYKCGTRKRSGKEACSLKPVRKEPLEQFVVKTALEKVLNDRVIDLLADKLLEYQSKENTRLPVLQAELKEVKRRIDNLVAAIEQGILTPSTKSRMEELEQQREALETSILQEQIETPPITREQILFWFDQFRHGDPADIAFQEKVIDCFVNSIYLFDDRIVVNERLSRDDFGKDDDQQRESNSISNQKAMLEEFAARQGFTNIVHFTDDGISGTCFDRPGFLAMMKEVESGNVEYLCIKDMSRMGRDYLKVGQIMEILRQRGVRLIAINDGVDSARGDDDFTPFRNIMNDNLE